MALLALSCLTEVSEDEEEGSLNAILLLEIDARSAAVLCQRIKLARALEGVARLVGESAPTGLMLTYQDDLARIVAGDAPWSHEPQYSAASLHDEADEGVILDQDIPLKGAQLVETLSISQAISRNSVSWSGSIKTAFGLDFFTRGLGMEPLTAIANGEPPTNLFATADPSDWEGDDEEELDEDDSDEWEDEDEA